MVCGEGRRNHVTLINVARVTSDNARIGTSDKTYRSHFRERFADDTQDYLAELGRPALVEGLAKVFLKKCGSPKPKSEVKLSSDVYLEDNFQVRTMSRSANCYASFPYPFNATEEDAARRGIALETYMGGTCAFHRVVLFRK